MANPSLNSQQSSRNEIHHLPGLSEKDNGHYRIYDVNQKTMQITGHNRILRGILLETIGETKPLLDHKKQEAIEDNSEYVDMNKFFESLPIMKENN